MHRGKQPLTHDEREKIFENVFGSVRADSGGTGMGLTDEERDATLQGLSFDQLPSKPTDYTLPELNPTKIEHPSLMDDLSAPNPSTETKPLELDDKTKAFVAIFDHVPNVKSDAYGGQSYQPDTDIQFPELPERKEEMELPDVTPVVPERDFLKEDQEERDRLAREKPARIPSKRYSEAHDTYVKIFGEVEDQN